jgi:hypothetical protein
MTRKERAIPLQARPNDKYGNWTEKRSYEHKERFGKTEWVLANIYRREITYR